MSSREQPGPLAIVAAVLGGVTLVVVCMGCMLGIPYVAFPLTMMSIVIGVVEIQRIRSGEGAEAGLIWAQLGLAGGGTGCLLQLMWVVAIFLLFVAYFALIIAAVVLGQ